MANTMHVITLTETEKAEVRALGHTPEESLAYCRPCWRIVSDKERGARLLQGMIQMQLTTLGVENADKRAEAFYRAIIAKATKQPVS